MWNTLFSADWRTIQRVLDGDREAFAALVDRHFASVRAFAYGRVGNVHDAEDVTQETFLNAYKSLGSLKQPAKFGSWLLAIAANVSNTLLSARNRTPTVPTEPLQFPDPAQEELHAMLRSHVQALDEKYRDVLLLHYFAGRSTKEIAGLLNVSKDAVQKRLQRGRDQLGERLVAELGDALAPLRPNKENERRVMSAVVALPNVQSARPTFAPMPEPASMPAGIYLALGTLSIGLVGAFTWFNSEQAAREEEVYAPGSAAQVSQTMESDDESPSTNAASPVELAAASSTRTVGGGFQIAGLVTNAKYEPVSGAIVRGYALSADVTETRTDDEGEFIFQNLPPQAYRIRVTHDEYQKTFIPNVAPGRTDLHFILEPYPSVQLQVLDVINQSPVEHFAYLNRVDGVGGEVNDPSGRFELDRIIPGKPTGIEIRASGYRDGGCELVVNGPRSEVQKIYLRRNTILTGIVLSPNGAPVWQAAIQAELDLATTDPDGRYRLETRSDTPHRVYAHHPEHGVGYSDVIPDPAAWEIESTIRLQPAGAIQVSLSGAVSAGASYQARIDYESGEYADFKVDSTRWAPYVDAWGNQRGDPNPGHVGPLFPGGARLSYKYIVYDNLDSSSGMNRTSIQFYKPLIVEPGKTTHVSFRVPDAFGTVKLSIPEWNSETRWPWSQVGFVGDEWRVGANNTRERSSEVIYEQIPAGPSNLTKVVYEDGFAFLVAIPVDVPPNGEVTIPYEADLTTGIHVSAPAQIGDDYVVYQIVELLDSSEGDGMISARDHPTFLGLVPGDYRVRLRLSRLNRPSTNLHESQVPVSAGQVTEVGMPEP